MTEAEREERLENYRATLAHLRLSGMELGAEELALFQRYRDGEWTSEQFSAAMEALNERDFGPMPEPDPERPWETTPR